MQAIRELIELPRVQMVPNAPGTRTVLRLSEQHQDGRLVFFLVSASSANKASAVTSSICYVDICCSEVPMSIMTSDPKMPRPSSDTFAPQPSVTVCVCVSVSLYVILNVQSKHVKTRAGYPFNHN